MTDQIKKDGVVVADEASTVIKQNFRFVFIADKKNKAAVLQHQASRVRKKKMPTKKGMLHFQDNL